MKKIFKYTYYFFLSLKNRGLFFTLRLMYNEWYWEKKLGISSMRIETLPAQLSYSDSVREQFHHYQGASFYILHETFRHLPAEALNGRFIDFGCGKARVLLVAANHGFSKISGIDIDKELLEVARKNISVSKLNFNEVELKIKQADAATFQIPDDCSVLFFFNPFGEVIMSAVKDNLLNSLSRKPRKLWVVYVNPKFESVWTDAGFREMYSLSSRNYVEAVILQYN